LEIKKLIDRGSILDSRNANVKLDTIEKDISQLDSDARSCLTKIIEKEKSAIENFQRGIEHNKKEKELLGQLQFKAILVGIFYGFIPALIIAGVAEELFTTKAGLIAGAVVLIVVCGYMAKNAKNDLDLKDLPMNVRDKIEKHKSNVDELKSLEFEY